MATKYSICHMRDTTSNWEKSTYVIPYGELVVEQCTDGGVKIKVGDGNHIFKELPYVYLGDTSVSSVNGKTGNIELTAADLGVFVQSEEPSDASDGDMWIDMSV